MWPFSSRKKAESPVFRGTPAVRRVKRYASDDGHTYRYSYKGWQLKDANMAEHFFECRRDDAPAVTLSVRLQQADLDGCVEAIGRDLLATERYAIVKLALFAALDARTELRDGESITPDSAQMTGFLRQLGRTD